MNKRRTKKTRKQLGFRTIGATIRPDLYAAFADAAEANGHSLTEALCIGIEHYIDGGRK